MLVYIWVPVKSAVLAGKTTSGALPVTITEEWLSGLDAEERAALARKVKTEPEKAPGQFDCLNTYGPELIEATLDTVLVAVRALVQKARAEAEAKRKEAEEIRDKCAAVLAERRTTEQQVNFADVYVTDDGAAKVRKFGGNVRAALLSIDWPYYTDDRVTKSNEAQTWAAELHAENERRKAAAVDAAKVNALAEWEDKRRTDAEWKAKTTQFLDAAQALIRMDGTDDQRGRLEDGLLPLAELEIFARDHAFSSLADFPRYERLTASDVEHDGDDYITCEGNVSFDADTAQTLEAEPWRNLKAIENAAPEGSTVTPRYHRAKCDECDADTLRYSAHVEIDWHGRTFAREYAI